MHQGVYSDLNLGGGAGVSDTASVAAAGRGRIANDYMKQFRSKDDEDPQERKLREIKKEIDSAMAVGDIKAFDHAKYKLKQLELQTEREEELVLKNKTVDVKKNEEINRRMLRAIDAKLAILNNL